MQNLAENLWTFGKVATTCVAVQSVNVAHSIQAWRKGPDMSDTISLDEEIHKIMLMYKPSELSEEVEEYLMNLRTDILDISSKYDNDIRVQLYIHRNSHSFGDGKNIIVINITDSKISMKVKTYQPVLKQTTDGSSLVQWAGNSTKNVFKRVSSLNFL